MTELFNEKSSLYKKKKILLSISLSLLPCCIVLFCLRDVVSLYFPDNRYYIEAIQVFSIFCVFVSFFLGATTILKKESHDLSGKNIKEGIDRVFEAQIEKIIKDKKLDIYSGDNLSEVVKNTRDFVYKKAKEEASESIIYDLKKSLEIKMLVDRCEAAFKQTIDRLYSEIKSLAKRGATNLSLGIAIGGTGLVALLFFVLSINYTGSTDIGFIYHFAPRISFVILLETFSYFFLRLYKTSLEEIKYYQNELTNIEQKFAAAIFSMDLKNPCITKEVIAEILKTERNFILKKGETTVEIEKEKIGDKNILSILNVVSKISKN